MILVFLDGRPVNKPRFMIARREPLRRRKLTDEATGKLLADLGVSLATPSARPRRRPPSSNAGGAPLSGARPHHASSSSRSRAACPCQHAGGMRAGTARRSRGAPATAVAAAAAASVGAIMRFCRTLVSPAWRAPASGGAPARPARSLSVSRPSLSGPARMFAAATASCTAMFTPTRPAATWCERHRRCRAGRASTISPAGRRPRSGA